MSKHDRQTVKVHAAVCSWYIADISFLAHALDLNCQSFIKIGNYTTSVVLLSLLPFLRFFEPNLMVDVEGDCKG